jgi:hypothetical protein
MPEQKKDQMKYRDNMTPEEAAQLLAECEAQDAAYKQAAEVDAANAAKYPENAEEADATEEQSLQYFNRYIAGDR